MQMVLRGTDEKAEPLAFVSCYSERAVLARINPVTRVLDNLTPVAEKTRLLHGVYVDVALGGLVPELRGRCGTHSS